MGDTVQKPDDKGTAEMSSMTTCSKKARYRPGAKRRGVRVIPHATRLRTQLTWRNLVLVAGFCLVIHVCLLAQHAQSSRRRLGPKKKKKININVKQYGVLLDKLTRTLKAAGFAIGAVAAMVAAFSQLYCVVGGTCGVGRRLTAMERLPEPPNNYVRRRLPVMERLLKEIEAARAKEY